MSINTAAMRVLVEKGLSASDILEIMEAMDIPAKPMRSNGAERQARYIARKKAESVTNDVSSDVTNDASQGSPIENNHTPPSSSQPSVSKKARSRSFAPPEGVSDEQWSNLMACRKAKRAAMTDGAYFQICRKLKEGAEAGWPPGELVDRAVERGWTTVFIPEEAPNGRMVRNLRQGVGGREHSAAKLLRDLEAEAEREAPGSH